MAAVPGQTFAAPAAVPGQAFAAPTAAVPGQAFAAPRLPYQVAQASPAGVVLSPEQLRTSLARGSRLESRAAVGGQSQKRDPGRRVTPSASVRSRSEVKDVLLAVPHRQNLSAAREKGKATGADKLPRTKNMPTRK